MCPSVRTVLINLVDNLKDTRLWNGLIEATENGADHFGCEEAAMIHIKRVERLLKLCRDVKQKKWHLSIAMKIQMQAVSLGVRK